MNTNQFAHVKELVGKPIENVSQFSEFVKTLNNAGIEVSYGTALMSTEPINGEPHVYLWCSAGFDSESWSQRGTKIDVEPDNNDGFKYRLSESSGWWFQFQFSLNCIVTDIEWDMRDDYDYELPTIVVSRFYMPLAAVLDEEKRREEIIKRLEANYEIPIKSIGQVIIGPSKKIHVVHPDYDDQCDLTETFVNNNAMDGDDE